MTDKKINQPKLSCCDIPTSGEISTCKECGNKGKSVKEITLKSILKESKLENIKNFEGFYFCETSTCKVVYFNNEQEVYLDKGDVKVRVGIKETKDPIPVCYCFGWTQEKIFNQIKQLGHSTAVQEITAKVKAGECACERNNPSGRCCLGEVNKVIERGMELYGGGVVKNLMERIGETVKGRIAEARLNPLEDEIRKYILMEFARKGKAPTPEELMKGLGVSIDVINQTIEKLENADILLRKDDTIISAYPFSALKTYHKVIFKNGHEVYALCATDAIGIHFMLNKDITILSKCPECKKEIQIIVKSGKIDSYVPEGVVEFVSNR